MGYNGWTLYDEVTIVINQNINYKNTGFKMAYIVNPKDKKQLKTAINWVSNTSYIIKNGKQIHLTEEPLIITTKNEGFRLELLDSAGYSSQGGKLSFWNCLVSKQSENLNFVVGINADILLQTLIQNTFINGRCKETLSFARCNGGVGLINNNMKEYAQAKSDMKSKEKVTKGKTTKWQLGCSYETLTKSDTYLGKICTPILVTESYADYGDVYEITLHKNKNKAFNSVYNTNSLKNNNINNIKKLLQCMENKVNKSLQYKDNECITASTIIYDIAPFSGLKNTGNVLESLPARKQGEYILSFDNLTEEEYLDLVHKLLTNTKEKLLDTLKNKKSYFRPRYIPFIFTDIYKRNITNITETEKQLLELILSTKNLSYINNYKVNIYTHIDNKLENGINLKYLLS